MINKLPKIDIDQLKEAIKITELAKQLGIELNRSNKALCVFHNEKTPSLSFNDEKGIFKCFSCDKHGDIIDLYGEIKRVSKGEAIRELAEMAGLTPATHQRANFAPRSDFKADRRYSYQKNTMKKEFIKIYEELVYICGGLDEESEKYLKSDKRGLTDETINRFLLCSVGDYDKIKSQLYHAFDLDDLKKAGVFSEKGHLIFYKHKILIPFLKDGRVVFIQGRRVEAGEPKYLHLRGVSVPLFNTDTLQGLKKGDTVYICEGVFDAMMLEQHGYHAVAILGVNNFKPEMTHQFKDFNVVLALDNDEAGERASVNITKMFLLNGQEIKAKQLPDGDKDVSDFFINFYKNYKTKK